MWYQNVGYTFAAHYLNKKFPDKKKNEMMVGGTRTLVGMLAGLFVKVASDILPDFMIIPAYFTVLFGIRMFEWHLVLIFFYGYKPEKIFSNNYLVRGTLWSYFLDLPASIGYLATAGFWIC